LVAVTIIQELGLILFPLPDEDYGCLLNAKNVCISRISHKNLLALR
jgi:hypothetical protein